MWSASALNANDIWAVGGNFLVRGDRTIREAVVLHYTGTWQLVPATLTDTILYDVKMLSPTEGYAVGANMIARWDGTNWSQVAAPNVIMHGLYMLGSGEGWAVGFSGEIWRDHNGVWSQAASPTTRNLWAVAMDSASHGWAVGGSLAGYSVLLEYDGTNWVDRTSTLPPGNPIPRGIYLAPGGEGWIVGGTLPNEGRHPILHLQDGAWSVVPYDDTTYLYRVQPEALGEYWAVGENAHHYVGGSWHRADLPTRFIVYAFALIAGRGGWVLGSDGNIVRYEALAPGQRFYDVLLDNTFYTYIEYMASHGIVSGYSEDNTFRWGNNTTRAQLSKIMVLAEGWTIDTSGGPHFSDVPQSHPFYGYIETAYNHGIISGYTDGTFRPYNNVTRTQLSKIVVLAEGWAIDTSGGPHFRDVSQSNPFYGYVETAYNHSIISGYGCGPGCLEFRPGNDATRGQICKIVYLAVTQP
jgi:hypothetical protein